MPNMFNVVQEDMLTYSGIPAQMLIAIKALKNILYILELWRSEIKLRKAVANTLFAGQSGFIVHALGGMDKTISSIFTMYGNFDFTLHYMGSIFDVQLKTNIVENLISTLSMIKYDVAHMIRLEYSITQDMNCDSFPNLNEFETNHDELSVCVKKMKELLNNV